MDRIKTIEKHDRDGNLFYLHLHYDEYFNITSIMHGKECQWIDGFIQEPLSDGELMSILTNFIERVDRVV